MARRTFIILWVLASAASILVALKGAALIDDQVIQPLPASIVSIDCDPSADECRGGSAGALTGGAVPAEIVAQLDDQEISAAAAAASSTEVSSVVSAAGVPGRTADGNLASPESSSSTGTAGSSAATTTPPRSTTQPTPTSPAATTAASATTQPTTTGGSATTPTSTTKATTTTRATTTTQPATTQPPATTAPPTTAPQQQTKTFQLMGGTTSVLFSSAGVDVLWATAAPGFTVEVADEDPGKRVEFRSDTHRSRIDVWWSNGPQWLIRERADNGGGGGDDDGDHVGTTSTTEG